MRAAVRDGFGCRQKAVRSRNYFITSLDSKRQQTQMQGGGSGTQRDAVSRAAKVGEFTFERFDFLAQYEGGILADPVERRENFVS
jgi:hypothetical protein